MTFLSAQSLRSGGFVSTTDGVMLVNPASVDMRIAQEVELEPGEFTLASTLETVRMPDDHIGFVAGKSSNARCGLLVECAGLVDPGFSGTITLELCNLSDHTLVIREHQPICQLSVAQLDAVTDITYSSVGHYQHQSGPTPSVLRLAR